MENNQKTAYEVTASELGEKLVALYKTRLFPRDGKLLADTMFSAGFEAGSLLQMMAHLSDRPRKVETANRALEKLCQAEYLVSLMEENGYYKTSECFAAKSYIGKVIENLETLLKSAKEADGTAASATAQQPIKVEIKPVIHTPAPKTIIQPAPAAGQPVVRPIMPDGFDDPV